jgi:hypothetical protein
VVPGVLEQAGKAEKPSRDRLGELFWKLKDASGDFPLLEAAGSSGLEGFPDF